MTTDSEIFTHYLVKMNDCIYNSILKDKLVR